MKKDIIFLVVCAAICIGALAGVDIYWHTNAQGITRAVVVTPLPTASPEAPGSVVEPMVSPSPSSTPEPLTEAPVVSQTPSASISPIVVQPQTAPAMTEGSMDLSGDNVSTVTTNQSE